MRKFEHIGIVTDEKQPNEVWVEATRVWVSDPRDPRDPIEYLRYEPDTPVTGPLRTMPHVAFMVDKLEPEMEGREVILEPFHPYPDLRVVFVMQDGLILEFMEQSDSGYWFDGFRRYHEARLAGG